jgi:pimeloyl-ACP methyl ester carboxylesterase
MPFTVVDLAEDVRAVLDACNVRRARVLGMSMGGMIAQELALRHPEYVAHQYLVGTIPPTPAHVAATDYTLMLGLMTQVPPRDGQRQRLFLAEGMMRFASPAFDPPAELLEEVGEQIHRRVTPRVLALFQARAIGSWKGPHRLLDIEVPTTIIQGAEDPVVQVPNGRRLAQLIRGSRYVELDGVGHCVPWEAGDRLLEILGERPVARGRAVLR